jgi:hypothetical protein
MVLLLAISVASPKPAFATSYAAAITAKLEKKTQEWEPLRAACEQKATIEGTDLLAAIELAMKRL